MTKIEWTTGDDGTPGEVWNPTTGCDKVSPGCGLPRFDGDLTGGCYAMAMAKRLKGMGQPKYQHDGDPRTSGPGFGLTVHPDVLGLPLTWRKPRRVFVNSMSDLFHDQVPDEFIVRVFAVMATARDHTFQLLTKRHARMRSLLSHGTHGGEGFADMVEEAMAEFGHAALDQWPLPNLHLGVSAEDQHWADIRVPALLQTPAAVRWVSAEPLLGPIRLPFTVEAGRCTCGVGPSGYYGMHERGCGLEMGPAWGNLHWVVAGGESGPGARPADMWWFHSLRGQCAEAGVPFFMKQLGSGLGREMGAGPKGGDIEAFPEDLRVREFPVVTEGVPA